MNIVFQGKVVMLGAGAVAQCFQYLLIRHVEVDYSQLVIIDGRAMQEQMQPLIEKGAQFVQLTITKENYRAVLETYLGNTIHDTIGLLIDLSVNVESADLIDWCQEHNVLYINTALENWPIEYDEKASLVDMALYSRHWEMRQRVKKCSLGGPTAIIEHGANPGLVSHWTKEALATIAQKTLDTIDDVQRKKALEHALADGDFPLLGMLTGTKVIHISERDTQITNQPKKVNEFVNTWSIDGFFEEGTAPAELGWGSHEKILPEGAEMPLYGPRNQIFLNRMGMLTLMRSWVPVGEIIGMLVRHGEAYTISNYLTVRDANVEKKDQQKHEQHHKSFYYNNMLYESDTSVLYRPTVHYVYVPCDAAWTSIHELRMNNFVLQQKKRIINEDIIDGADHVGVLLLGHDLNGWWTGSQLTIQETRSLIGSQNATTLQVAASLLGALFWMIKNPNTGFRVPDELPYREILQVANAYLGTITSVQTDWNPTHIQKPSVFKGQKILHKDLKGDDLWQFENFRA